MKFNIDFFMLYIFLFRNVIEIIRYDNNDNQYSRMFPLLMKTKGDRNLKKILKKKTPHIKCKYINFPVNHVIPEKEMQIVTTRSRKRRICMKRKKKKKSK